MSKINAALKKAIVLLERAEMALHEAGANFDDEGPQQLFLGDAADQVGNTISRLIVKRQQIVKLGLDP